MTTKIQIKVEDYFFLRRNFIYIEQSHNLVKFYNFNDIQMTTLVNFGYLIVIFITDGFRHFCYTFNVSFYQLTVQLNWTSLSLGCVLTVTGCVTTLTSGTWSCSVSWCLAPCWLPRTRSTQIQREIRWKAFFQFYTRKFITFLCRFSIILIISLQQYSPLNAYLKLSPTGSYSTRAASVGAASTCWTCWWWLWVSYPLSSGNVLLVIFNLVSSNY